MSLYRAVYIVLEISDVALKNACGAWFGILLMLSRNSFPFSSSSSLHRHIDEAAIFEKYLIIIIVGIF